MDSFLAAHKDLRADLYLTLGDEQQTMLGAFSKITGVLAEKAPPGVRWQTKRQPEETHTSNPYRSTYDGLERIFDGWFVHGADTSRALANLSSLEANYRAVSDRMGYVVPPTPTAIYTLLRSLLTQKRYDEAEATLNAGLALYPTHIRMYLGGMLYNTYKHDEPNAIAYAKKLLQIAPAHRDAREVLARNGIDIQQVVPEVRLSSKELASFVGAYASAPNNLVEVSLIDGKLILTSDTTRAELHAIGGSKFYIEGSDGLVMFRKDTKRGAQELVYSEFGRTSVLTRSRLAARQ